ncbi:MAG: type IX secretion system outer membrane channel protein PorV [Paludibacteraceae bacterium]|nr:type IX secretion system outer membrane channel protein PorV [Paludibacteraceae bacterium]
MKKLLLSALFVAICSTFAVAQNSDNDYYNPLITGVPSLSVNPDAVGGGMGDVGVSTLPDINSQYWNPSKYALAESHGGFAISYTPWLHKLVSDINVAYLSGYYNISDAAGAIGASLRYFSYGKVNLRESAEQEIPITVKPYEFAFDLGYSRKLAEYVSMGVTLRYINSDLSVRDENYYPGHAFGADVSLFYMQPFDANNGGQHRIGVGLNLSNIGTKISYDKGQTRNFIPANLRLGVSYYLPFNEYNRMSFTLECNKMMVPSRLSNKTEGFDPNDQSTWMMSSEAYSDISSMKGIFMSFNDAPGGAKEEFKEVMWNAGIEYSYNEQFFARAGYCDENASKGNRKFFTVGAGFKLSAFRLDVNYVIARAQTSPLDQTLRFTLAFDVDGLKDLADRK